LLRTSPWTPTLPAIEALAGHCPEQEDFCRCFVEELATTLSWRFVTRPWQDHEREEIAVLAENKYRSAAWNEKR
jgi:hypothetical protein